MRKIFSISIIAILLITSLMACKDNNDRVEEVFNTVGNTAGNINNEGLVTKQGDWLFYCQHNYNGIYKVKADGTEKQRLSEDWPSHINVVGEWIYYCNDGEVYKMKTDGTERKKIYNEAPDSMIVIGEWIYFSTHFKGVYKMKTDGTEREKMVDMEFEDDWFYNMNIVDDWIYYCKQEEDEENDSYDAVYRMKLDGTEKQKISNDDFWSWTMCVVDDWIYCKLFDEDGIYRMKTDGSEKQRIIEDEVASINVVGEWIYYVSYVEDGYRLYKVKTDGAEKQRLNDRETDNINVVGDWIYYTPIWGDEILYKVKTDGTEDQEVDDISEHMDEIKITEEQVEKIAIKALKKDGITSWSEIRCHKTIANKYWLDRWTDSSDDLENKYDPVDEYKEVSTWKVEVFDAGSMACRVNIWIDVLTGEVLCYHWTGE